jgi:hypothetical protein
MNGQRHRLLGHPAFSDPNVAAQGSEPASLPSSTLLRTAFGRLAIRSERNDFGAVFRPIRLLSGKWRVDGNMADVNANSSIVQNVWILSAPEIRCLSP